MNMVSESGATRLFLAENEPRTLISMNSQVHSAKFCIPAGTPAVTLSATFLKKYRNSTPRKMDQNMVSTWMDQNPIALISAALWAMPQEPSGNWP